MTKTPDARKRPSLTARERKISGRRAAEIKRQKLEARADRERQRGMQGRSVQVEKPTSAPPDRLSIGARRQVVHREDGSVGEVLVRPGALRRMGLITRHQHAAERFLRDWEAAGFSGLACRGFEPGVDGSRGHNQHLRRVEAQGRIHECKKSLGDRQYDIVVAVLVHGANTKSVLARGGRLSVSVSNDIEVAFNSLVGFYTPGHRRADPNWKAFREIIELGEAYFAEAERQLSQEGG